MEFRHYKEYSTMNFTWKERIRILFTGTFKLSKLGLSHTANNLMKMIFEWKANMNEETRYVESFKHTEIK
jgi:hypothetical protein